MKTTTCCLAFLLALSIPPAAAQQGTNLIRNGGFEQFAGDEPVGWETTNIPGVCIVVSPSTKKAAGKTAVEITVKECFGSKFPGMITQGKIRVTGPIMRLSFSYQLSRVGQDVGYIGMDFRNAEGSTIRMCEERLLKESTTFADFTATFPVPADAATAESLVADGRGWSPRLRIAAYSRLSDAQIFAGLRSWSPVVRERSAMELARREGDPTPRLIAMLDESDLHARLGACQGLIRLEARAAPAVPALKKTLKAEGLWLRIKAAEALASMGKAAMSTVPDLLTMLVAADPESDPRGMQQRYLCFALFDRRGGMLGRSLEGVDREALYAAVRAGLGNEDGRARGTIGSVYRNLSYEEIEPLLPAIYRAVIEPAPSGIMFADGIRLRGLEILARHRIEEGLALCVSLIAPDRWGLKNRIKPCLASLRLYGAAAKSEIPRLRRLEKRLAAKRWKPEAIEALGIPALIREIETDEDAPVLRSLARGR